MKNYGKTTKYEEKGLKNNKKTTGYGDFKKQSSGTYQKKNTKTKRS